MTSEVTAAVSEPSKDTEPTFWATHVIGGREIHFNQPTIEQLMVLRRVARQLGDETNTYSRTLTLLGKALDAVSACISTQEESDFVDQLVLDRKIDIGELGPMVQACLAGPGADKPAKPEPKRRVRRR